LAEREEVLHQASQDLISFGRVFLPNDFLKKAETPPFHHVIGRDLLATKPGGRVCNIVPRGHGKSTLMRTAILYKIYFAVKGDINFIAWIGETQDKAKDHTEYLKYHIENNDLLSYYFGEMRGDLTGNRWTGVDWTTAKGDRLITKGIEQDIRGKSERGIRFTGIVLDDFESIVNTRTKERRAGNRAMLTSAILPALEETKGKEGWIWLSGTIPHYDSFLQGILDGWNEAKRIDKEKEFTWKVNFYTGTHDRQLSDTSKALWEDLFPVSKLKTMRRSFIDAGTPHLFAQEIQNDARDRSLAPVDTTKIKYHAGRFESRGGMAFLIVDEIEGKPDSGRAIPIYVYIGADPSITGTSDFAAIVVLGIDSERNRYLIDVFHERTKVYDLAPKIVDLGKKYYPVRRCTIETVQAQDVVRDMAERFTIDDRRFLPGWAQGANPLKHRPDLNKKIVDKIDRLCIGLGSFINPGKLYIRREHFGLVEELEQLPKPKYDDWMDALYYADYYARKNYPRGQPISMEVFNSEIEAGKGQRKPVKKRYNWFTGARK